MDVIEPLASRYTPAMPQQCFQIDNLGPTLQGTAYLPEGERRHPTALICHGFAGNRIGPGHMFVRLARALVARGFAAFTFDYRGCGESEGDHHDVTTSLALADAKRALQWVRGHARVDRSQLSLVGYSMGGMIAAMIAAKDPAIHKLVMYAPTDSDNLSHNIIARADDAQAENAPAVLGPYLISKAFMDNLADLDALAAVSQVACPTLILQGDADKAVPEEVSRRYEQRLKQAGGDVTYRMISGANHNFTTLETQRALVRETVEFLQAD